MNAKDLKSLKWSFVWYGSTVGDTLRGGRVVCDREELFYVGEDEKQCEKAQEIIQKHNSDLDILNGDALTVDNWQPLSTAPRDGTHFLIKCGGDTVTLARFSNADPSYPLEFIDTQADKGGFFINSSQIGEYCITSKWQPLPN